MPGARSVASTEPFSSILLAAAREAMPGPHATSSTRHFFLSPANATNSSAVGPNSAFESFS
ncbi:MAG: hypothetical protein M0D55_04735 [Elusimicrobiota bacterium]|nr:MAG: hypothetical protein M0D55_04735 [Elusimicrobiota bacterium]